MIIPTQQQVAQRWNGLSPALREAFFSEANDDYIVKLCQSEHLPDEKIDGVFAMASYALLGFIHAEDLADELAKTVGLTPQAAAAIASGVNQRIVEPLKEHVGAAFSPVSKFEAGPVIIQDIGPAASLSPIPGAMPGARTPIAPSAAPLPGWSRETPSQPVVRLSQVAAPAPSAAPTMPKASPTTPAPSATSKYAAATPPVASTLGEFARLAIQRGGTAAPSANPTPSPAVASALPSEKPAAAVTAPATPEPAPLMIHEDTQFKPQSPSFHLDLPSKPIDMHSGPAAAPTARPAVLEIGTAAPTAAPTAPSAPMTTRVVHYSDYKPPAAAPQGPREVTEVTSAPMPSSPTPAPAPQISAPTQIPPGGNVAKVIRKDYSATEEPPKPGAPQQPAPPSPPRS